MFVGVGVIVAVLVGCDVCDGVRVCVSVEVGVALGVSVCEGVKEAVCEGD